MGGVYFAQHVRWYGQNSYDEDPFVRLEQDEDELEYNVTVLENRQLGLTTAIYSHYTAVLFYL